MRENIYYWKCDSPNSTDAKKRSYFKEKYDREGLDETVHEACSRFFGGAVRSVEPLRVDGNHTAFIVGHEDRQYFFRADDGTTYDDYMLTESALMQLAADAGVPVPKVYHTDVSQTHCPFRFQIMDYCPEPCLNLYHKEGTLDTAGVAGQLGRYLRRLHTIQLEGFGFINTERLSRNGHLQGLSVSYLDYFYTRLDDHLGYLRQFNLLPGGDCDEVIRQFRRHGPRLERTQGVLVHRDMALWNVLGSSKRIAAIIDWDDAVSGDPADDLGILQCFYDEHFMSALMRAYWDGAAPPDEFICRVWLHTLRNMLWKTMLRHSLGYFEKGGDFFLNTPDVRSSLKDHTLHLLQTALNKVRSFETP